MKLIIAIVQDEDSSKLLSRLMQGGFGVTKLATTGGFLKAGNTTLLLGVEEERVDEAIGIIETVCKSRKQMTSATTSITGLTILTSFLIARRLPIKLPKTENSAQAIATS